MVTGKPTILILWSALALLMMSNSGCSSSSNSASPGEPKTPPATQVKKAPPPPMVPEKIPSKPADPCDAVRKEAVAVLAKATNQCKTPGDCGCYNPVDTSFGCGGVTDKPTSKKLQAIEDRFHKQKCEWPRQCKAWTCAPRCNNGRCSKY
ncbi:hypothetical protein KKF84_22515 [Myxococcota bacterium]|nr:hypothetical protein [Myxococcota bacterium]MBU1538103.1 hypothetical protein [Myxococcota bacterium]